MKTRIISIFIFFIILGCKTIVLTEIEKNYLLNEDGKNRYYLIKLIREKQKEGILGEMPMVIVNGQPVYIFYRNSNANDVPGTIKRKIKSLKIVKAEEAVKTWGAAGKYGLIIISNSGKQEKLP